MGIPNILLVPVSAITNWCSKNPDKSEDLSEREIYDLARKAWRSYTSDKMFGVKDKDGSLFIQDISQDDKIVSEALAFYRLIAVQLNDSFRYKKIKQAQQKTMQEGLSYWVGRVVPSDPEKINSPKIYKVGDPSGKTALHQAKVSAADADQDTIFSEIQEWQQVKNCAWETGDIKKITFNIQRQLNMFWNKLIDRNNHRILPKPFEFAQNLQNVSYSSPAMFVVFNQFDEKDKHNWMQAAKDSLILRDAIIGRLEKEKVIVKKPEGKEVRIGIVKNLEGEEIRVEIDKRLKKGLIPDWVDIRWFNHSIKIEPSPDGRSFKQGHDAIRTIWRVALDVKLFEQLLKNDPNNKDLKTMLKRSRAQAKYLLKEAKKKGIPNGVLLFDNKGNPDTAGREMILACYTALASAARDEATAKRLSFKLKKSFEANQKKYSSCTKADEKTRKKYYNQTLSLLSLLTLKDNYRLIFKGRFDTSIPKDIQVIEEEHLPSELVSLETIPNAFDPEARSKITLKRLLAENKTRPLWYKRYHQRRFETASQLYAQRRFAGSINKFGVILENSDYQDSGDNIKKMLLLTQKGFWGAIKEAGLFGKELVSLCRKMRKKNPNNILLKLNLAKAYSMSNRKDAFSKIRVIVTEIAKTTKDPIIAAEALNLLARGYLLAAKNIENKGSHLNRAEDIVSLAMGQKPKDKTLEKEFGHLLTQQKTIDLAGKNNSKRIKYNLLLTKAEIQFKKGMYFKKGGKTSVAKKHFLEARKIYSEIASNINDPVGWVAKGINEFSGNRDIFDICLWGIIDSSIEAADFRFAKAAAFLAYEVLKGSPSPILGISKNEKKLYSSVVRATENIIKLPYDIHVDRTIWSPLMSKDIANKASIKNKQRKIEAKIKIKFLQLKASRESLKLKRKTGNRNTDRIRTTVLKHFEKYMQDILRLIPINRTRSHFERIAYYLETDGNTLRAIKDCESMIQMSTSISGQSKTSLLSSEQIIMLEHVVSFLRKHMRKRLWGIGEFSESEFSQNGLNTFLKSLNRSGYGIDKLKSLEDLNALLYNPTFYDKWRKNPLHLSITLNSRLRQLAGYMQTYKKIENSKLTPDQRADIRELNRSLLEISFASCPKSIDKQLKEAHAKFARDTKTEDTAKELSNILEQKDELQRTYESVAQKIELRIEKQRFLKSLASRNDKEDIVELLKGASDIKKLIKENKIKAALELTKKYIKKCQKELGEFPLNTDIIASLIDSLVYHGWVLESAKTKESENDSPLILKEAYRGFAGTAKRTTTRLILQTLRDKGIRGYIDSYFAQNPYKREETEKMEIKIVSLGGEEKKATIASLRGILGLDPKPPQAIDREIAEYVQILRSHKKSTALYEKYKMMKKIATKTKIRNSKRGKKIVRAITREYHSKGGER